MIPRCVPVLVLCWHWSSTHCSLDHLKDSVKGKAGHDQNTSFALTSSPSLMFLKSLTFP